MDFLNWLYLRLKNKHHEQNDILYKLSDIIKHYKLTPLNINTQFIDQMCKKHFPDFDMDKVEGLNFGFSEEERARYRNFVIDIISTITK